MEIIRDIFSQLSTWYQQSDRRPLLLRGVRQVGKSFAVRAWAKLQGFELIELNFEEQPRLKELFELDLIADRILDEISLLTGQNPRAPRTVIFFDEIQSAPKAITALRYFYEKTPNIPLIAAGSLIEFVIKEEGFPVGRVASLYLFPITFTEFLVALGKEQLAKYINEYEIDSKTSISEVVHFELLNLLRIYWRVGGMPKVVRTFIETRDYSRVTQEQKFILKGYRDDFEKYAKHSDWSTLGATMSKMGALIGRTKVKFSSVGNEFSSAQVRRAIDLLEHALIVHRVYPTHTNKLPLTASASSKSFKLVFLDIGLLHCMAGFDWSLLSLSDDLTDIYEGRFAEQFVGQEVIARRSQMDRYQLHYWDRPKLGSDAEVDYVLEFKGNPVPVEIKSGVRGKLRSLTQYIQELQPSKAFVLSQRSREWLTDCDLIPLYLAGKL